MNLLSGRSTWKPKHTIEPHWKCTFAIFAKRLKAKKHYRTTLKMRISYLREALESQNPTTVRAETFCTYGWAPRQALKPIRLKFVSMTPVYLKSRHPQNHRKPRYQYINKNRRKINILVPYFWTFEKLIYWYHFWKWMRWPRSYFWSQTRSEKLADEPNIRIE